MRNLFLIAVFAVTFGLVGIAHPNLLIAQDTVEEDLESDGPGARVRRDRGEGIPDRRENYRDRGEEVGERREDYRHRRGDRQDRREDYQDRRRSRRDHRKDFQGDRGYRRDHRRDFKRYRRSGNHRRDFRDHRRLRRDHKRDLRAHRAVRRDHKRYYSSKLDRRNRPFAKHHRYGNSGRSYKREGRGRAYRR